MGGIMTDQAWKPFKATAVDWKFVMLDHRTRPEPFAVVVDAIATGKNGDQFVKPSLKAAKGFVRDAAEWFADSLRDEHPMTAATGVLSCLFALRATKRKSPVVFLAGPCNPTRGIELIRAANESDDEKTLAAKVIEGLALLGKLTPHDDMKDSLGEARSQVWSANLSGLVMFVDVQAESQVWAAEGGTG